MSEDCHDSRLPNPLSGTETIPCRFCREPVKPEEAYLCELENRDGTTEVAVFHGSFDRMCPMKWVAERLENLNGRLEAIIALLRYCD